MSYVMEFEDSNKVEAKDTVIKYDGFSVVVDPKSLMFVYGMTLNYRFRATHARGPQRKRTRNACAPAQYCPPRKGPAGLCGRQRQRQRRNRAHPSI
jgi:uncharacterized membrane-anchored protein